MNEVKHLVVEAKRNVIPIKPLADVKLKMRCFKSNVAGRVETGLKS